jgi:hypothetical protein
VKTNCDYKIKKEIRSVVVCAEKDCEVVVTLPRVKGKRYYDNKRDRKDCCTEEKDKGVILSISNQSHGRVVVKARDGDSIKGCDGYFTLAPYETITVQNLGETWYTIAN